MTVPVYALVMTIVFIFTLFLYNRALNELSKAQKKAKLHMASQDQINIIAAYLQKYDTCVMIDVKVGKGMQPALQFYNKAESLTHYVIWKPSSTVYKYIRGDYHVVPKAKGGVG